MDLNGKAAIVTGSSRGIGRAIAVALASCGMDIIINHVHASHSNDAVETKRQIECLGKDAVITRADVSSEKDVKRLVTEAVRAFDKIHVLVNNAGVFPKTQEHH